MPAEHPTLSGDEYIEVDLSTQELRDAAVVDQVTHSLTHHDTMYDALTCALNTYLRSFMRDMLASASIVPLDPTDPYVAATVERIVNNATIDVIGLSMVGDIAHLCVDEHDGRKLPDHVEALRPKPQDG